MTCFLPQLLSAPSHPVPGYFLSSAAHTPCTLCWHNRVQHLKWIKTLAIVPKPLRLRVRSSAQMDKGSSLHLALEFSEHSSVLSCCPKHITGAQQVYAEGCPTRSRASMPDVKGMCPLLMTSSTQAVALIHQNMAELASIQTSFSLALQNLTSWTEIPGVGSGNTSTL